MRSLDPFEIARNAANRADPQVTRYLHSSVILDRKGKVISVGRNYFAGKVIQIEDERPINKTVHSEVHALSQVNIRGLQDTTIINYSRTNVASNPARPCDNCWTVLKKLGLKKVFYSIRSTLDTPKWVEEYF